MSAAIRISTDGLIWESAEITGPDPTTAVMLEKVSVLCDGCPPYEPILVGSTRTKTARSTRRRGRAEIRAVNPVTAYTDNMWCRRGSTIVPGEVKTQGIRVEDDGI